MIFCNFLRYLFVALKPCSACLLHDITEFTLFSTQVLRLKEKDPELAALVVAQIYDNALIAADILDNPRVSRFVHTPSTCHAVASQLSQRSLMTLFF
jgi:hypothetical protein